MLTTITRLLLLIIMVNVSASVAAERNMVIIPVINADIQTLMPILGEQLSEDSSISAYQQQLVINASAAEIEKIRTLLKVLDGAGKQLLISIKNNDTAQNNHSSVNINNGRSSGLIIKNGKLNTETNTVIRHENSQRNNNEQQGIRVTEGQPSLINTGSMMRYNTPTYNNNQMIENQQWQTAESGFYATTWLNGDTVSITVDQKNQAFADSNTINTQSLKTRVSGKLGEWIPLANINNNKNSATRFINGRQQNTESNSTMLYIKVELAE